MTERYSFTVDRHLVPNISVDGTVVWSQDGIDTVNSTLTDSITEGYVTAEEETQYLSVLDSTNEISLENLNMTLNNSKLEVEESVETFIANDELMEQVPDEAAEQNQVVVYSVEGSDELFGIQLAQDEEGNLQKYQFQFRKNKDGQLEAIPETIQLLPMDEEIQDGNVVEHLEQQEEAVVDENNASMQPSMHIFVEEDNSNEHILPDRNALGEQEGPEEEDEPVLYEGGHIEEVDIKPGIVALQNVKQELQEQQLQLNHEDAVEDDEEGEEEASQDQCDEEVADDASATLIDYNEHIDQNSVASEENSNLSEDQHRPEDNFEHIEVNPDLELEQTDNMNDDSDLEDDSYHIVEGVHITGDVEAPPSAIAEKQINNSNILRHALKANKEPKTMTTTTTTTTTKKDGRLYLYVVQHPEKENVDSLSQGMANLLCKPFKTNPRSILKSSFQARGNNENNEAAAGFATAHDERLMMVGKRFARCKEAVQARIFHNFINKTTIPQAPVRKDRLPRKQKIKPVERMDEEIVVQEVMVSNNGFVEAVGEGFNKENLAVTDYVELSDSDDDYDPKKKKKTTTGTTSGSGGTKKKRKKHKRKRIEITISDDEDEDAESFVSDASSSVIELDESDDDDDAADVEEPPPPSPPPQPSNGKEKEAETPTKRRRGRPPKNRSPVAAASAAAAADSSESPSKRARADSPPPEKPEIPCPKCDKTFPSQNSLKTHLQHHNLQSSLKNASLAPPEYKYKCESCGSAFKNAILLRRHVCPPTTTTTSTTSSSTCPVCKRKFRDQTALTAHRRTHAKERLLKTTAVTAVFKPPPPPSSSSTAPSSSKNLKCKTCGKLCSSVQNLNVHSKTHKEYACATCSAKFLSQLALEKHLREKCVKSPRRSSTLSAAAAGAAKVKCDKCESQFHTLKALFTHKVKVHGLETPDKSVFDEEKKTLHKQKREFCGIPPAKKLQDAYAGLRSRLNFDK